MNYQTMTDEELNKAYKEIQESLYDTVASIFGVVTLAQINTRDAIEKEFERRNIKIPEYKII